MYETMYGAYGVGLAVQQLDYLFDFVDTSPFAEDESYSELEKALKSFKNIYQS